MNVILAHIIKSKRSSVSQIKTITMERSEKRGQPHKIISKAFLKEVFRPGRNISISKLTSSLPVHKNTLENYMCRYKIMCPQFSTISNLSLDEIVAQYRSEHPNTGIRYPCGYLFWQSIRVQRERIVVLLSHIDNVVRVILWNKMIKRREYKSSRPNALWHVDGHHKLGPWGIVIHGFTDGYDRVVCECMNRNHDSKAIDNVSISQG